MMAEERKDDWAELGELRARIATEGFLIATSDRVALVRRVAIDVGFPAETMEERLRRPEGLAWLVLKLLAEIDDGMERLAKAAVASMWRQEAGDHEGARRTLEALLDDRMAFVRSMASTALEDVGT